MAEKKMGRPSNGKTIRIQVAVSEEVKAKLEEAAKKERRSMSMLCSIVLEEWVNQKAEQ